MKERVFGLRMDLDAGANIRRLHAYIRTINPRYQVAGRMERKIQQQPSWLLQQSQARNSAKLVRVK